jgi:putative transposase
VPAGEPDHQRRSRLTRSAQDPVRILAGRILVTSRHDANAATRFFRKLLMGLEYVPRVLATDKLASYGVAHRRLMPGVEWSTVDRSI